MTDSARSVPKPPYERLVSLDALRGFDIFLLFCLGIVGAFKSGPLNDLTSHVEFWQAFARQFEHVPWTGFTLCDLAMPLFVFMAGASIPFSLAKYCGEDGKKRNIALWFRIIRRVILLWFFGMCVQGRLLSLDVSQFKLFSNTLQSIAVGYFFSCVAYLYLPKIAQRVLFVLLLLGFWGACTFIKVGEYGGGSFAEGTNLAYWVDVKVLGRWMDCASVGEDGSVNFAPWYQYTWILSSLTFVATALSGMFAGDCLRATREKIKNVENYANEESKDSDEYAKIAKKTRIQIQMNAFWRIAVVGAVMLILGRVWNAIPEGSFGYCPIIKHIWTSSMVLHSSGISLLLLAAFYLLYDVVKIPCFKTFFVVFGANAFAAYILSHIFHFDQIASWALYGLEQFTGNWQGFVNQIGGTALMWLLLWTWYRSKFYVRV